MPEIKPKTPTGKQKVALVTAPAPDSQETESETAPTRDEVMKAALDSLPPNALTRLMQKHWVWVLGLIAPLVLTTYQSVRQIIEGPAQVAALVESTKQDHEDVAQLKRDVEGIDAKLDRVLWMMQTQSGSRPWPASQPLNY